MRDFSDVICEGNSNLVIAECWLSGIEFRYKLLGITDSLLMAKVAPKLFSGEAIEGRMSRRAVYGDEELSTVLRN